MKGWLREAFAGVFPRANLDAVHPVATVGDAPRAEETAAQPERRRGWWRPTRRKVIVLASVAGVALALLELQTYWLQAHLISYWVRPARYQLEEGESGLRATSTAGPYDERLGYTRIPEFVALLKSKGFAVEAQARWSSRLKQLIALSGFPIYQEKSQAGLTIVDRRGEPIYSFRRPEKTYTDFEAIPPVVVRSLLFIENREMLDAKTAHRNPAIEWDRLGKAVLDLGVRQVSPSMPQSGGSTLATQLEKLRHSPGGRTGSVSEKARQIVSASMRAYLSGPVTLDTRKQIVLDYINSIPLAATAGHGEVIGLSDGLKAWFQSDREQVDRLLRAGDLVRLTPAEERMQGVYFRQVLSLLLALNRPTFYLRQNPEALAQRVDAYLHLLAEEGVISERLRDRALEAQAPLNPITTPEVVQITALKKGVDTIRHGLLPLLHVDSLYDLDRLDLIAETTLDYAALRKASADLERLNEPGVPEELGLVGHRLLGPGQAEPVIYSLTLYEHRDHANRLLIQVDNARSALNLNEDSKLELGSTAKLRTLVTYLEIIAQLREQLVRNRLEGASRWKKPDRLTQWALEYQMSGGDMSLPAMLEAAMNRTYSASPAEAFFTGGGLHYFSNFESKDNGRIMTVREAFQRSVNLVFIRIMRDIVDYYTRRLPGYDPDLFDDPKHPARVQYLKRFADQEGSYFLWTFYERHRGLSMAQMLENLFKDRRPGAHRFAVIHRSLWPEATRAQFAADFLRYSKEPASEEKLDRLYEAYGPGKFDWNDRGYLADVHPLELWLIRYLHEHPDHGWKQVREASAQVRQEVYRWLFKENKKRAQDTRIRTVLEADAFEAIHRDWKRQGYPFRRLVPSLATSIGSSGDTPAALAELAGIILNGGLRYPTMRVERLEFAAETPFATIMRQKPAKPERVLRPEVAAQLRREMLGVVEFGTARRAYRSVVLPDGRVLPVGGKTGTGDNRDKIRGIGERVRNRTATFVFTIGDRYFGTVVAYVPGEGAGSFHFTSSLPVQIFKTLVPKLLPDLERPLRSGSSRLAIHRSVNHPKASSKS